MFLKKILYKDNCFKGVRFGDKATPLDPQEIGNRIETHRLVCLSLLPLVAYFFFSWRSYDILILSINIQIAVASIKKIQFRIQVIF